jgi:hypothetical protein
MARLAVSCAALNELARIAGADKHMLREHGHAAIWWESLSAQQFVVASRSVRARWLLLAPAGGSAKQIAASRH